MRSRAAVAIIVFIAVIAWNIQPSHLVSRQRVDDLTADLQLRIRSEGARAVYEQLVATEEHEPPAVAHRFAHAFGSALYEVEGMNGFFCL